MENVDMLCSEIIAIYTQESDHKIQTEKLCNLLNRVFSAGFEKELTEIIRRMVETVVNNESTSMVVSRQFITDIAEHLNKLTANNDLVKRLAETVLHQLQTRAIAYEEQSTRIRMTLALAQERDREFEQAAQTLMGIPLETGQRGYTSEFKMELYLRITELFLEAGNIVEADRHVKRASLLQQDVKEDTGRALMLKYNSLYARALDRQGCFIEAASRYYELSLKQGLLTSEKQQVLQNALTCTLLAPPGIQRNRLLNTLFKDERSQSLIGYALMKNMYLERLIKEAELTEFEASLAAHQQVLDSDGASILQRSVLEHNVLAASRLYANISFEGLGQVLGVSAIKAEKISTQMISTDKVRGFIDQLQGTISFEVADAVINPNNRVDMQIASICELTNSINERLAARFPEWHAERIRTYNAGAV